MMSQRSKRELVEAIHPRYLKADRIGKDQILDEFLAATGYHRKYAIRVLKQGPKPKGRKKVGRSKTYQGEVVQVLEQVLEICGRICSKRVQSFLAEIVAVLERCDEIKLSVETKKLLLEMGRATIDRCLKKAQFIQPQNGLSTTKPGSLLKKAIPIRTFTPCEDERPGFMEIDLVAHCGSTATGWTECLALANKTQSAVSQAICELQKTCLFLC